MKENSCEILFCKNVSHLRRKNNLSQREMANKLNIGVGTLRKLESGTIPKRASIEILWCIYEKFNIPFSKQFEDLSTID